MKKLAVLLVLVLATSTMFAEIHDNSGSTKTGNGSFKCTVIEPLTIDSPQDVLLGEFVVSTTAYSTFDAATMTFNVTGQKSHAFFYVITEDETDPVADITIGWGTAAVGGSGNTATLSGTGTYTFTGTVSSLTAKTAGTATFQQSITVSYNTF